MYLYRFEVTIEQEIVHVIVAAQNDVEAFQQVEIELEKHFLKVIEAEEISLFEKKKIGKGTGFVIDLNNRQN